jgi:hypothetical protein
MTKAVIAVLAIAATLAPVGAAVAAPITVQPLGECCIVKR